MKWNHEDAKEAHSSSSKKKHRHHRKQHSKVGVEEDANGTTTIRYTSDEIVENKTHMDGKEETKIKVPDHRESKQPMKQA